MSDDHIEMLVDDHLDELQNRRDWFFHGGPIYDPSAWQKGEDGQLKPELLEALYIASGKVVAAGSLADVEKLVPPETVRIDLKGKALLPGFNDAHIHLWKVGHLLTTMLDLRGVGSITELRPLLRERSDSLPPGAWLEARGYNEAHLAEGRHPTRHDMDAAVPDRPVWMQRTCAHIAVANSRALEMAEITRNTPDPPGGVIERDAQGEPTGVLHETALGLIKDVVPPPTQEEYQQMILSAGAKLLEFGVTSITDPAVMPDLIAAYQSLHDEARLPVRCNLLAIRRPDGGTDTLPLPKKIETDWLSIRGVKFFADGGLSGATAAMSKPYISTGKRGVLRFKTKELMELAGEAQLGGFQIATHVIGDEAIEQVLSVYSNLAESQQKHGLPPIRHRLEHVGLPTDGHLKTMAERGVIAVSQPIFIDELGDNFEHHLEDERLYRVYPYRSILNAKVDLAFSTDAPVVRSLNPLQGIAAAVTRRSASGNIIGGDEAVTIAEALRAYTLGGTVASGEELKKGGLQSGYLADLVILSGDPLTTPAEELTSLKVSSTLIGGKLAYVDYATL